MVMKMIRNYNFNCQCQDVAYKIQEQNDTVQRNTKFEPVSKAKFQRDLIHYFSLNQTALPYRHHDNNNHGKSQLSLAIGLVQIQNLETNTITQIHKYTNDI